MSKLGVIMRQERERLGLTQIQVAKACGVDRSMISNYEREVCNVPPDVSCLFVRYTGSEPYKHQCCFECPINMVTMPYLDLVDMHPMTVRDVLIEEFTEAIKALEVLSLRNKLVAGDLTEADYIALEHAIEQVMDIVAAKDTFFTMIHRYYNIDIEEQAIRGYEKLFTRGFATRQCYEQHVSRLPVA